MGNKGKQPSPNMPLGRQDKMLEQWLPQSPCDLSRKFLWVWQPKIQPEIPMCFKMLEVQ